MDVKESLEILFSMHALQVRREDTFEQSIQNLMRKRAKLTYLAILTNQAIH